MDFTGKALVTGASGFVGSAVARKLAERGLAVRALVRPGSPREHSAGLDIEFVTGDLRDPDVGARGDERRALPFSRRGRLPAVGARPQRDRR